MAAPALDAAECRQSVPLTARALTGTSLEAEPRQRRDSKDVSRTVRICCAPAPAGRACRRAAMPTLLAATGKPAACSAAARLQPAVRPSALQKHASAPRRWPCTCCVRLTCGDGAAHGAEQQSARPPHAATTTATLVAAGSRRRCSAAQCASAARRPCAPTAEPCVAASRCSACAHFGNGHDDAWGAS